MATTHSVVAPHCCTGRQMQPSRGELCAVSSRVRACDVGDSGCFAKVKPPRAVTPKSDLPLRQPLDLAEVLTKLATVLDKPRRSHSLKEEFGADQGQATTETKYTEVPNGGGSEGKGSSDWTTMPKCSAFHAAHGTSVREDLIAEEYPLHDCGHLRCLRKVIGSVAGAFDQGESGGFVRQHAMKYQIYGLFEASPVIARHEEAAAFEAAQCQLKSPTAEATLKVKTSTLTTTTAGKSKFTWRWTSISSQATGTAARGAKETGLRSPRSSPGSSSRLCWAVLAASEWVARVLCIDALILQRDRVHEICRRGDRHSSFPSRLRGGIGFRCPPARAVVRALTATRLGLSSSHRVVSYGSAMEV